MIPISVCIIAKNEEATIEKCLSSIQKYPFEIVVVDTGSTDRTKEIAAKYTTQIFDFEWNKNFSDARNFSTRMASHNWVLILDCDEYIETLNLEELYLHMKAYPKSTGSIIIRNQLSLNDFDKVYVDRVIRLYHKSFYHFSGSIHEQIVPKTREEASKFLTSLTIYHTGYALNEDANQKKNERNLSLLLEELKTDSKNPYLYHQIGQTYKAMHELKKAASYYEKAITFPIDPNADYARMLIISYGNTLLQLERNEDALSFENFYDSYANTADFVYLMGRIYLANNQLLKALMQFIKATSIPTHHEDGTNTFLPYYYIGVIYDAIGSKDLAITFLKKCGDFAPALEELSRIDY